MDVHFGTVIALLLTGQPAAPPISFRNDTRHSRYQPDSDLSVQRLKGYDSRACVYWDRHASRQRPRSAVYLETDLIHPLTEQIVGANIIDLCINNAMIYRKKEGSPDCSMQPRSF
jgi:hypothetical protein